MIGTRDPLWSWVGRKVSISVNGCNEMTVRGYVYSIDPESGAWLLTASKDLNLQGALRVVFAAAIKTVELDNEGSMFRMFRKHKQATTIWPAEDFVQLPSIEATLSQHEGTAKYLTKAQLLDLLAQHHLPSTEEDCGVIRVLGSMTIHPPYRDESFQCANEIILNRVKNILSDFLNLGRKNQC